MECLQSGVNSHVKVMADMTKTWNGLQNGLTNGLEGTCLKRSFGHRNPLYSEHTT